jgi:hypothetical protein
MMPFKVPVSALVMQLEDLLAQLSDHDFVEERPILSGATLGQHFRHVIELFMGLKQGYATGVINYDNRARNRDLESSRARTAECLAEVVEMLSLPNKALLLEVDEAAPDGQLCRIDTNFVREVGYNLEHAVHHMAIIKMALLKHQSIVLPKGFGVASSTLKYREACAQ